MQVDVKFGFDGYGHGHVFLRGLVSGGTDNHGVISQRPQDEEGAASRGLFLIGWHSFLEEFHSRGRGDRLSGIVAYGYRDFRLVTAEESPFGAAVLASGSKRQQNKANS